MNYCETCKHRDKNGLCQSGKIAEELQQKALTREDMLIYDYNEDGEFWVGPKFGCVHHAPP